jgi:hypothetical protein
MYLTSFLGFAPNNKWPYVLEVNKPHLKTFTGISRGCGIGILNILIDTETVNVFVLRCSCKANINNTEK